MSILNKIRNKWTKIRLQPINVYCLHHVCTLYDPESMKIGDWMNINEFKRKVLNLQQNGIKFISLTEAYNKITKDTIRTNKYSVLTFDDGYESLKEILPWLIELNIPVTLFVNGKYLDGISYRDTPKEKYLNYNDLKNIAEGSNGLISIANHGWEHTDASKMTQNEFKESILKNINILSKMPNYTTFWAYTWGRHNELADMVLTKYSLIPTLIDGRPNIKDTYFIHRIFLP